MSSMILVTHLTTGTASRRPLGSRGSGVSRLLLRETRPAWHLPPHLVVVRLDQLPHQLQGQILLKGHGELYDAGLLGLSDS